MILAITLLISVALFYALRLTLVGIRKAFLRTDFISSSKTLLFYSLALFVLSLFNTWGLKKFWIFEWGEFKATDVLLQAFLLAGWYLPSYTILFRKPPNPYLLRAFGVVNISIPFITAYILQFTSRTFISLGTLLYWLSSVILFIAIEIYLDDSETDTVDIEK